MGSVVRGGITRADFAAWDGKTPTTSRVDASGGTTSGLSVNDYVDVLQVYGDGTSRTRGSIEAATARIGSSNVTLRFAPGSWDIDDDLTIPSNFTCYIPAGCLFDITSAKTLTISGPIIRESTTWTTGSGTVTHGNYILNPDTSLRIVYPTTGLTAAAGGAQGGVPLSATYNVFSTVTSYDDSCTLPATFVVGTLVYVINMGTKQMQVWPASGDDLSLGADTPVACGPLYTIKFMATVADSSWAIL